MNDLNYSSLFVRNSSCSKWNHICGRKGWLSMDTDAEVATELKQYRIRCNRMNGSRILYFSDFGGIFGFSLGISMISFFTCFQWLYKSIARTITCKDSVSISSFSLKMYFTVYQMYCNWDKPIQRFQLKWKEQRLHHRQHQIYFGHPICTLTCNFYLNTQIFK